jgi:signal transduction histidine kinase
VANDILNPASVSAMASVGMSFAAAAAGRYLGRAPEWGDVKALGAVGMTACVAAACNVTATLEVPTAVYVWTGRVQLLAIALHVAAWYVYVAQWRPQATPRLHAWLLPLVVAGLAALVPGVAFGEEVRLRPVPWLGVVYHDPVITVPGVAVFGVIACYGVAGVAWIARMRRSSLPFPRMHLGVAIAICAMGLHDAVVVGGLSAPTPYLVDFASYGPMAVLATIVLKRVVTTASDLHRVRAALQEAIVDRSVRLEKAQAALGRAERLAALGQFSAGVAHEVNNPAAALAAHLDLLGRALADDRRAEIGSSLREARAALDRITGLSGQLLVAGRTATRPRSALIEVRAARAAEAAAAVARARGEPGVLVQPAVPAALTVLGHEEAVIQILSNLAVNGVQAISRGRKGTVTLRAETAGDRVRLVVEDDGEGMSEETLLHVFEPFYTTKPRGMGSGLGLAVSRGLAEGMGGTLRLESRLGVGTRAILELARGAPAPSDADLPAQPLAAPRRRARILLVDDDPQVLEACVRLMAADHEVTGAPGVWEGLAALDRGSYDLVLCDAVMPLGGGERFWEELLLRAPELRGRVAFVTAGAVTPEVQAFLERQPQPVLAKPLELSAVEALAASLGPNPASIPAAAPEGAGPGFMQVIGKLQR